MEASQHSQSLPWAMLSQLPPPVRLAIWLPSGVLANLKGGEVEGTGAAAGGVALVSARSWYLIGVDEGLQRFQAGEAPTCQGLGLALPPPSLSPASPYQLRGP
jgi:hypothetical protein